MNDSAVSIEMLKDILIDPDFESVCPPLTEDEFSLLEQNILSFYVLFDCNTFRKISRLVNITAALERHVIGKQLQRYHAE